MWTFLVTYNNFNYPWACCSTEDIYRWIRTCLNYNQGHSTWVTLLWYLSFSVPMLFCNGSSVKLSKFEAIIERNREKWVEQNVSTLFLQLTQVLMSRIVDRRCRSSRPLDRGGGAVSKNDFFRSFRPHFGRKIRGDPGPSSGSATECDNMRYHILESASH